MNATLNWGMLTITKGYWRIQIYWPYIRVHRRSQSRNYAELMVSADTVIRLALDYEGYCGVGIQLLGFGLATDYLNSKSQ